MKYSPTTYAEALKMVLVETPKTELDNILKNFMAVIVKNGDYFQRNKIIDELENIFTKEAGGKVVMIETARSLSDNEIQILKGKFTEKDLIRQKINKLLVAGVRVTVNGNRELDQSLTRKLKQIFIS